MNDRRLPVGAEPQEGGVHFRVWAPSARKVEVVLLSGGDSAGNTEASYPLEREEEGYHSGLVPDVGAGALYRYRLDGGEALPDPASRRQPEGPHGPSEVLDPGAFRWTDDAWPGLTRDGQVFLEVHVGTATPEGTFRALAGQFPHFKETGITVLELMPLSDFPGEFGWGYDGVAIFAPYHGYGTPDDLRALIDAAHALGIGLVLDVVYNHLGPDGNFLPKFAPAYFSREDTTDWGDAINFDGRHSAPVREFFLANVNHWISEYHFDGLRLDATQNIYDRSETHIILEMSREARRAAGRRAVLLVAENEAQQSALARPADRGGYEIDMLWNDDFHHSAVVALTGRREAYYNDHGGGPQELVSTVRHGYLYQGQWYLWQRKRRGSPALDLAPEQFVTFLENHDQVANSFAGERLVSLTAPASLRALTAYLLLAPATPMLFQGQEWGSTRPFDFFADHNPELAAQVYKGRKEFLRQFQSQLAAGQVCARDPGDPETFRRCKLDFEERRRNAPLVRLHRDLLKLRRLVPAFGPKERIGFDGAVLGPAAFLLRWFAPSGDRLLLVNLGVDLRLDSVPEPLLAPPAGEGWELEWSSEDVAYGGLGTSPVETQAGWRVPGHAAVLFRPGPAADPPVIPLAQEDVK